MLTIMVESVIASQRRPLRSRPAGAALWAPPLDRNSPLSLSR
jgi:hypothetical protein